MLTQTDKNHPGCW